MLKIGDFSRLARISIRMLRHYDDIDLLKPVMIDKFTKYRYYSESQLPLANRIAMLKNMGFSLDLIRQILDDYINKPDELKKYLLIKYEEIKEQSADIQQQLQLLESAINKIGKDSNIMEHTVILKEIPRRYVMSVRKIIPTYYEEGQLWHILMSETKDYNMQVDNPCNALAIFHDDGFKENDVDVEVQMSVIGDYADTENVKFKYMEAIQVASCTYKGSYDLMDEVYKTVAEWVSDNGYEINEKIFDIYHVSPHEESNPDNYVTEVCFPVMKR